MRHLTDRSTGMYSFMGGVNHEGLSGGSANRKDLFTWNHIGRETQGRYVSTSWKKENVIKAPILLQVMRVLINETAALYTHK